MASVLAAIWKFLALDVSYAAVDPIIALASLFPRVRAAPDVGALDVIEDEIDAIVEAELSARSGAPEGGSRQHVGIAVSRLERAVARRRAALEGELKRGGGVSPEFALAPAAEG